MDEFIEFTPKGNNVLKKIFYPLFAAFAFLVGANYFVGISSLDVDAYNLRKKPWLGRSDNLSNFLPLALRLSNLPSDTTFNQFQSEIMSRQSKAKAEREQVLSVLNANPLTPDVLLRNRLAIIEIALSSGYEDPTYGSHCGGLFAWLQQE